MFDFSPDITRNAVVLFGARVYSYDIHPSVSLIEISSGASLSRIGAAWPLRHQNIKYRFAVLLPDWFLARVGST